MRTDARRRPARGEATAALRALAAEAPVPLRVEGSSMAPGLLPGERVWISPRRFYWPGDLVAFPVEGGTLLLHRVVGYRRRRGAWALLTQGDAAAAPDGPVPLSQVVGRVVRSEGLGPLRVGVGGRLLALARGLRVVCEALARRVGR